MKFISILMGSKSDYEIIKNCVEAFEKFDVRYELNVFSNFESFEKTQNYIKSSEEKGAVAFISTSSLSSHLSETIASNTIKPVIAIPMTNEKEETINSLVSTVNMPKGMPVGTVSHGEVGAINAAYFAMQILAVYDKELAVKLKEDRMIQAKQLAFDSASIEVIL